MARKKRITGRQSSLLEQSIEQLHLLDFQVYDSLQAFKKATITRDRYVIRCHPHPSLYGTPGKKEAVIVGPHADQFFPSEPEGGLARIVVEAKYQDTSGSTDEKLPYIWEAFLVSEIPNWIVILDGNYWKSPRGKMAVAWIKDRPHVDDRTFVVTDRKGFMKLAKKAWGSR